MMWQLFLTLAFLGGFFLDFADWVVDNRKRKYYSSAHIAAFLSGMIGGILMGFSPNAVLAIIGGSLVAKKVDHPIYLSSLAAFLLILLIWGVGPIHPIGLALYGVLAFLDEILPLSFVKKYRPFLKGGALGTLCLFPQDALAILFFDAGYHLNGWVVERSIGAKGSR